MTVQAAANRVSYVDNSRLSIDAENANPADAVSHANVSNSFGELDASMSNDTPLTALDGF